MRPGKARTVAAFDHALTKPNVTSRRDGAGRAVHSNERRLNDMTTLVRRADGSRQEYIMPSQLPARLGAESAFFAMPGLPTFDNGVIQLDRLAGPTTLGYIYGEILSTVGNTQTPLTQTTASNLVFKVTLVPR